MAKLFHPADSLNSATPQEWDNARSAMSKQVGGQHYKDCAIQPVEYIMANKLGYCAGNVVKYVTRHAAKGGKQDLEKAKHYIELLMEQEYGKD